VNVEHHGKLLGGGDRREEDAGGDIGGDLDILDLDAGEGVISGRDEGSGRVKEINTAVFEDVEEEEVVKDIRVRVGGGGIHGCRCRVRDGWVFLVLEVMVLLRLQLSLTTKFQQNDSSCTQDEGKTNDGRFHLIAHWMRGREMVRPKGG